MTLTRRDLATGVGVLAVTALATSVSACSPAEGDEEGAPTNFFAALQRGDLSVARSMLSADATLTVLTYAGSEIIEGPQPIVESLYNSFRVGGWRMIGDGIEATRGGFYWIRNGTWLCSDMVRGRTVSVDECNGGLMETVMNIQVLATPLVNDAPAGNISRIILIENNALTRQMQATVEDRMPRWEALQEEGK